MWYFYTVLGKAYNEPMILVAMALATRSCLVSSGEADVLIGENLCVHPSSDWSMIKYSAARVLRTKEDIVVVLIR